MGQMVNVDSRKIWEQVQANHRKLDSCKYHEFVTDITPQKPYDKKWQCKNCLGEVGDIYKRWYEKGIEHGVRRERFK